jgi:hypothetical protein
LLLELGSDFSFIGRQKRITVDNEDYYLNLLFFHRRLRRLLAIDFKLGRFRAADKGQMELYLRWLEKHERKPGEESPLGLILCAGKSDEHVELLQLERSGIRVAEYLTELPPREILGRRLHEALRAARKRFNGVLDASPGPTYPSPETRGVGFACPLVVTSRYEALAPDGLRAFVSRNLGLHWRLPTHERLGSCRTGKRTGCRRSGLPQGKTGSAYCPLTVHRHRV